MTGRNHEAAASNTKELVSHKGTIRGIKNRVRASIVNLQHDVLTKPFREAEKDKIVIYTTSVAIIRKTYEQCKLVTQILSNHRIRYECRDISVNKDYLAELKLRTGEDDPQVPQVFAGGAWLGDAERTQFLNELGELEEILKDYPRIEHVSFSCNGCGGLRYVPCPACNGTKKSLQSNPFTSHLRCMKCDRQGLARCAECQEQQE